MNTAVTKIRNNRIQKPLEEIEKEIRDLRNKKKVLDVQSQETKTLT
jgi:uncharacterized protein YeeX (DUF496 family)